MRNHSPGSGGFSIAHSLVLAGFLATLVTFIPGYTAFAVVGVVLAAVSFVVAPCGASRLDGEDRLWLFMLLLFGTHLVLDAWRSGAPVGHQTVASLPWWPFLAALLLLAWRRHPPRAGALWLGVILGALGAGGIAVYQGLVLGASRASNGINAIPFGNLSLLLGVLALAGVLSVRGPWWRLGLGGLAVLGGLTASLLSGTRGGWVTLPVVAVVLVWAQGAWLAHGWLRLPLVGRMAAVALIAGLLVFGGVQAAPRFAALLSDVHAYIDNGNTRTSVGLRFDMWRCALALFLQKPVWGWGEGAMMPVLQKLIASGRLNEQAQYFGYQLHSEWLDTAARRGFLGLITLVPLYLVPLLSFTRRLALPQARTRALALAGVLVVVMFLGFGLTQTQFRDERAFACYLVLIVACWTFLRRSG